MITCLIGTVIFFILTGVCQTVEVHQTPSDLLSRDGDTVQLICTHSKTDYTVMLWYFQKPGDTALTLIGSGLCVRVKHLHLRSELDPATSYQYSGMTSLPVPAPTPVSDAKSSFGPPGSAVMVTMIRLLTIFSLPLFCITGVSLSQEVNQTPFTFLWKPEEKIQLSCSHNIPSYYTILWYQRSVGDTALKLIAYVSYKSPTVESPYQGIFDVSGDGDKEAYLHLLKLRQPEDDGQYFCAASFTVVQSSAPLYKNLSVINRPYRTPVSNHNNSNVLRGDGYRHHNYRFYFC
ncbi:uncharacterized protein LOC134026196 isoform X2 [Osmerus eperlanus]|uniref:uncharacterized protein LOC134026196 isoform X2 n=1 Tax=Osmerus eperlanus TaxID=29151 RepID=UPI002E13D3D6